MMTFTTTDLQPIGWGWIPNISGRVTDSTRLAESLDSRKVSFADQDIKHKVDYTDELIDLAKATREQASGTDRLSRITAAFAGVSMVVAIVTILLAIL